MLEAVFVFGLVNIVFEAVLLCMLKPRTRLRVLGDDAQCNMIHIGFLALNLYVHWGTVTGTMSAVVAFVCSLLTIKLLRTTFGYVRNDQYRVGFIKFSREELL